jgi:hypothetical protein
MACPPSTRPVPTAFRHHEQSNSPIVRSVMVDSSTSKTSYFARSYGLRTFLVRATGATRSFGRRLLRLEGMTSPQIGMATPVLPSLTSNIVTHPATKIIVGMAGDAYPEDGLHGKLTPLRNVGAQRGVTLN